jgi:NAD dependent epimerase/dehydratase
MATMHWEAKRVFVTGAGGFIGSHLCEALVEQGAEVTALIHYNARSDVGNLDFLPAEPRRALRIVFGNVEDADFLSHQIKGQQVVFHLAALIGIPYSYIAPRSYARTNIEGTINILETARAWDIEKVVHTSTSEVYGTALYVPIDEKHPLQGQSPYSASKIGADKLAEAYHRSFGVQVATVRPFNTFGPRQSGRAVIPAIISQALSKPEIRLGSLEPIRDLTYVKDTVRGFIKVAEAPDTVGQVVNLGTGTGVTIGDLAHEILRLMSCQKPIMTDAERIRPAQSEVFRLICDNTKAKELAGWSPEYALSRGLEEVIRFVSAHPERFAPERYAV